MLINSITSCIVLHIEIIVILSIIARYITTARTAHHIEITTLLIKLRIPTTMSIKIILLIVVVVVIPIIIPLISSLVAH